MMHKSHDGVSFRQNSHEVKDFFGVWRRLLSACRPYRLSILFSVLAAIGATVCTIVAPLWMAELTTLIEQSVHVGVSLPDFTQIALVLLGMYVAGALLFAIERWLTAGFAQHVSHHIRFHVFEKINRLPVQRCEHMARGDLLSRVTNDVDAVGHALHESIGELLPAIALLLGSLFMMLLTDAALALVAIAATLLGVGGMLLIMRRSQRYFLRQQENLGALGGYVEQCYTGYDTVRSCNAEQAARERFLSLNAKLNASSFYARFMAGMLTPLMSFMANFGYFAVCVCGAVFVMNGRIDFGVVVAFMFFVHHFAHPFAEIATAMQAVQSAAAAGERVYEFLDLEEMEDEGQKLAHLSSCQGGVVFDNVSFRYPDADRDVIRAFSLAVEPGKKVAIFGPSGTGKTTLAHLLSGFYLPCEGEIRLDGVSTADLSKRAVHEQVSLVLQTPWFFEGSVRDNLVYCTEEVSEERMRDVCRAVGIDGFISALPEGYDTAIGQGITLSEGQRQQLSIARVLIADRPVLVLDEATVAMDPMTEAQILDAIDTLAASRTVITIAHRLETLRHADVIVVMCEGRVCEQGTHEQLLAQNGFYAELYRAKV